MSDWPRLPIRVEHLGLIRELLSEKEYRKLLEAMDVGRLDDRQRREVTDYPL